MLTKECGNQSDKKKHVCTLACTLNTNMKTLIHLYVSLKIGNSTDRYISVSTTD